MPGTAAQSIVLASNVLVAMLLFAATYLSFVRLLRYPRNWLPPALSESLATTALAAATVAHVARSPDGIDAVASTVVALFIIVYFYVVAAPSIAFRPAAKPVEFLARHGNHAGLWMLGPAVVAGIAVSNPKLQAILATAMAIELAWCLGRRWDGRRRQLYRLDAHDLAILKRQAEGDLEGFRRRHAIRELEISDSGIGWRGCGKATDPCPFNLYVNRRGLNTAPCCREHLATLCRYVASCLSDMGYTYWLDGGTLLGAVREGGAMLKWEDDVDLSVLLGADTGWDRLVAELAARGTRDGYFVYAFKDAGSLAISYEVPKPWPFRHQRNRLLGEIRLDLFAYREATSHGQAVLERRHYKGAMPATESGGYGVPREIVLPTSTIPFLGGEFACPRRPEAYLGQLYGDFQKIEYSYVDDARARARQPLDVDSG